MVLMPYIERDALAPPFHCYANDVDCDRCGASAVSATPAQMSDPWHSPIS